MKKAPSFYISQLQRCILWGVLVLSIVSPTVLYAATELDLQDRLHDVLIEHDAEGSPRVVIREGGQRIRLTPHEYIERIARSQQQQRDEGFLFVLFNITGPLGVLWVALGLLGQVLFTGRMVVQWLVSEKQHQSVVPVSFWWLSLIGASMLIVYFIWRKDVIGVLGQAAGWAIYVRNLYLIHTRGGSKPQASRSEPGG